jgi:hypothetical protein
MTEQIASVIAAVFSAIATAIAAFAAWKGPIHAAKLAEELRRTAAADEERRRLRLQVFTTLMGHRAVIYDAEAVRNFNLIDVVFHDSRDVRDAWSKFFASLDQAKRIPQHTQDELLHRLLNAMAADLGLSGSLVPDDLSRVYYPGALAEAAHLEILDRRARLQVLRGGSGPAANSAPVMVGQDNWPPPPPRSF